MAFLNMGDFMSQNAGNFVRVLGFLDQAAVNHQPSARQGHGVHLRAPDQMTVQALGFDAVGDA